MPRERTLKLDGAWLHPSFYEKEVQDILELEGIEAARQRYKWAAAGAVNEMESKY